MITIDAAKAKHDHRVVRWNGSVIGFCPLDSEEIRLTRCPNCRRENYAPSAISGTCAWCWWDANDPKSGIAWNNNSSETAAMTTNETIIRLNIREKVAELKADGVTAMSRDNLYQITPTDGVICPAGEYRDLFDAAADEIGFPEPVTYYFMRANEDGPTLCHDSPIRKVEEDENWIPMLVDGLVVTVPRSRCFYTPEGAIQQAIKENTAAREDMQDRLDRLAATREALLKMAAETVASEIRKLSE